MEVFGILLVAERKDLSIKVRRPNWGRFPDVIGRVDSKALKSSSARRATETI
jgi:hypothetical protein